MTPLVRTKHAAYCRRHLGLDHFFPCWVHHPFCEGAFAFVSLLALLGIPAGQLLRRAGASVSAGYTAGTLLAALVFLATWLFMRGNQFQDQRDTARRQRDIWERAAQDNRRWYDRCMDWRALAHRIERAANHRGVTPACDILQQEHARAAAASLKEAA